ncbi:tripartite tricarboxylate transporter TctB family protein [Rhodobaculum claviforme]|uniref:DUF1468 domain-containing protein n=1 Tax=Rhodobaculum claviforme TaxID=1549854 RepID=A0A934WI97_9RHOB|nr:tripartite tricarboxylate transporter TctB family protein [Rhodobaculum claviforme]MBK5926338.1 hypothetical protein [Rhodobaculum claviforme]
MSDAPGRAPSLRRRLARPGVIGGVLALALGLWVMAEAAGYAMGSARRMGPGYFPTLLGGWMAAMGAALAGLSLWREAPADTDRADPRALLAVLSGIAAFALLLPRAGLVPAVAGLVVIAAQGSGLMRPGATLVLAGVLAILSWGIFRLGLGLPLPAFTGLG